MNNGRLWLVVNPTVGIPLFLGAVALTSLTVHSALLNNTTWLKDFYAGSTKMKTTMNLEGSTAPVQLSSGQDDFAISVKPVASTDGTNTTSFVVTVTPKNGSTPEKLALSATPVK
jgi:light-harvesting protein B-800-850 alpha chain